MYEKNAAKKNIDLLLIEEGEEKQKFQYIHT